MAASTITTTRDIFSALTQGYSGNFSVRLWDGSTWQPSEGPTPFRLVLKHPRAIRAMFWPFTNVSVGESCIFDDYDIEGDIFALTGWLRHLVRQMDTCGTWDTLRLLRGLMKLPNQKNPRDRAKAGRPTEGDHSTDKERKAISPRWETGNSWQAILIC